MREFFRCWKRKTGSMALVMACTFAVGWLRSRVYADCIAPYRTESCNHWLASAQGQLKWFYVNLPKGWLVSVNPPRYSLSEPVNRYPDTELEPIFGGVVISWYWHWQAWGFRFGHCDVSGFEIVTWQVPYWSVVIPLTLLSAYLLLSKPRQSKQPVTHA